MLGNAMPSLDFSPQIPSSPLFPLCLWRGFELNHFRNGGAKPPFTQDLSGLDFTAALKQVYSELSFSEMARLTGILQKEKIECSLETLLNAYGFGYDQRLIQAFDLYLTLPNELQTYIAAHSLSARDILPLLSLAPQDHSHPALQALALGDVSRNHGAQLLDLLTDLILLEIPAADLLPQKPLSPATASHWMEQLKALRFPQTKQLDDSKETELTSLPWTKDFKTRWQRQGDQSGLEVRFVISSKEDLTAKLKVLERVAGRPS